MPNRNAPARRGPPTRSDAESEALVRFRKVLALELKRGCDDGAVIGGVDRFLDVSKGDPELKAIIDATKGPGGPYSSLQRDVRETWLRALVAAKAVKAPAKAAKKPGSKAQPAAPPAKPAVAQKPSAPTDPLEADVTVVKGVKGAMQARLAKLELHSVRDLLYLFPNRHNDFANIRPIAELEPDEEQTTLVTVWSASVVRLGRRPGTQAVVGDDSGTMRVVWFNQPYLADQLRTNDRIVISGKVSLFNRLKTMENPEWERLQGDELTHTGRLVPSTR